MKIKLRLLNAEFNDDIFEERAILFCIICQNKLFVYFEAVEESKEFLKCIDLTPEVEKIIKLLEKRNISNNDLKRMIHNMPMMNKGERVKINKKGEIHKEDLEKWLIRAFY